MTVKQEIWNSSQDNINDDGYKRKSDELAASKQINVGRKEITSDPSLENSGTGQEHFKVFK